jgi:hypothetical protein
MHIREGLSQPWRKLSCAATVGCRTAIATIARILCPSCRRNCVLQVILIVCKVRDNRWTRVAWVVEWHAKIWSERGVSSVWPGLRVEAVTYNVEDAFRRSCCRGIDLLLLTPS